MTEFLTYELLSPEDAEPVMIRITGQRERGFEDFRASNRVTIKSHWHPAYCEIPTYAQPNRRCLCVWGEEANYDYRRLEIPLADWPLVRAAIAELNEAKKEKDMNDKPYFFDLDNYDYDLRITERTLTVTPKKPKVKVEWSNCSRFGDGLGENGIDFSRHGYCRYHIVQFRVTGWDGIWRGDDYVPVGRVSVAFRTIDGSITRFNGGYCADTHDFLYIGLDARDKFSAPVLLPESIYSRLDEITKALEDRANGGKG